MTKSPRPQRLLRAFSIALVLAGCSSAAKQDPMNSSLGALAKVLARYNIAERGNLPKDVTVLKQYVTASASDILSEAGITDAEQLFVSPRDGQPLKFILGADRKKLTMEGDTVVAYEQQGQDGTRWVVTRTGVVQVVPDVDLAKLGI